MDNQAPVVSSKRYLNSNLVTLLIVLIVIIVTALMGFIAGERYYSSKDISKNTITVYGLAKTDKTNEVATYSLYLMGKDVDKTKAVESLNGYSQETMKQLKEFGVEDKNLKTTNYNVYQNQEWDPITQKSRMGDWQASLTIEVKLTDTNKTGELTALLSSLDGLSNLWGPNYQLTDDQTNDTELFKLAVEDARLKAEKIALSSGKRLGKVIKIDEVNVNPNDGIYPLYDRVSGGGGGAEMYPGTSSVSKSVVVIFEIK